MIRIFSRAMMSLKESDNCPCSAHFDSKTAGPKLSPVAGLASKRIFGVSAEDAPVNQPHLPHLIGSRIVIRRRNRTMSVVPKPSQLKLPCERNRYVNDPTGPILT